MTQITDREARGDSATGLPPVPARVEGTPGQPSQRTPGQPGRSTPGQPGRAEERTGRRRRVQGIALVAAPVLVVVLFVGVPVVNAALFSLGFTGGLNQALADIGQDTVHGFSLAVYGTLLGNPVFLRDLAATLGVTALSTGLTIALAVVVAVILRLRGGVVGKTLSVLAVVPIFVPVVIASWSILTFTDAQGFLRSIAAQFGMDFPVWGYTLVAVVFGSVWTSLPFAVLMIAGALQGTPDALIEAAKDAGASTWRVVWQVLLPMATTPIVIAVTFTVIGVLGSFTVPYFTGPNAPTMLGVDISKYFQAYNRPQQSTAMAFIVFAFAAAASVFYLRSTVRSNAGELQKEPS
ncbi:carbohydrate ABC transporter membrane protein 1 (CUT1 family) [Curtobacterium sp. PhB130]|uniref:ABC transporter permease n=1 Tax=unclassified Curtobacterium TaxID=257496 RepID=UPI000FA3A418|nr:MULTISPECIES: ABC transporter permease subunit [unclassified Curtobacterium]ROS74868.1 carbohydrate ABC transporter membrane protein 1 (CUT1 family) [Curtobacterium sp. PhB130]TCK63482.1 carbohydrate ABC transporter membrane protein 1 (CUT1 family) [Curtobacterium sp. PhB136]